MCGSEAQVKMAYCSSSPGLVCARGRFIRSPAPLYGTTTSKWHERLCLSPKIAVLLSDRWALPDPSGTHSLDCLHVWKVLDIRLDISKL